MKTKNVPKCIREGIFCLMTGALVFAGSSLTANAETVGDDNSIDNELGGVDKSTDVEGEQDDPSEGLTPESTTEVFNETAEDGTNTTITEYTYVKDPTEYKEVPAGTPDATLLSKTETVVTPPSSEVIHHDAVTHEEEVIDQEAWTETIHHEAITHEVQEEDTTITVVDKAAWDEKIEHEATYKTVTVEDVAAYDEVNHIDAITEEREVIDQKAWTETIEHPGTASQIVETFSETESISQNSVCRVLNNNNHINGSVTCESGYGLDSGSVTNNNASGEPATVTIAEYDNEKWVQVCKDIQASGAANVYDYDAWEGALVPDYNSGHAKDPENNDYTWVFDTHLEKTFEGFIKWLVKTGVIEHQGGTNIDNQQCDPHASWTNGASGWTGICDLIITTLTDEVLTIPNFMGPADFGAIVAPNATLEFASSECSVLAIADTITTDAQLHLNLGSVQAIRTLVSSVEIGGSEPWTETIEHEATYKTETVVIQEARDEVIHHDAVTHEEEQIDQAAWTQIIHHDAITHTETVKGKVTVVVDKEAWDEEIKHDATYKTVVVVDKEAWDEEIKVEGEKTVTYTWGVKDTPDEGDDDDTPDEGDDDDTPDEGDDDDTPDEGDDDDTPDEGDDDTPDEGDDDDTDFFGGDDDVDEGVLGAIREMPTEAGVQAAVLGARRGPAGAVLGARRSPKTGDPSSMAAALSMLGMASAAMGGWAMSKKRREDETSSSEEE